MKVEEEFSKLIKRREDLEEKGLYNEVTPQVEDNKLRTLEIIHVYYFITEIDLGTGKRTYYIETFGGDAYVYIVTEDLEIARKFLGIEIE